MKKTKKPPLGIIPEFLWKEQRLYALCECILRNQKTGAREEWIRELWVRARDLLDEFKCLKP